MTFVRSNLLVIALIFIAFIFIIIGIYQLSLYKPESSVEVITSEANASEEAKEETVVIDISGAVLHPGVYSFTSNTRIGDAIKKAGGLSNDADISYIEQRVNLAQMIIDGQKLYIPRTGEQAVLGTSSSSNSPVTSISINTASISELDKLSGIGPVTAQKIIDGRPYSSLEEVVTKKIMSKSVYETNKSNLSL